MTTTAGPTASASSAADRVRIAAARLRITTDAKQGKETPQWVRDLAQRPKEIFMTADIPEGFEPAEVSFAKDHVHNAIEQELEKQGIDPYSERADQPSPDLIDLADAVVERLLTEGVTIPASVRRLH